MIVVDTNIISYLFIEGAKSNLAEAIFLKNPKWLVPHLWRSEFCSVLLKYINHRAMSISVAINILAEAEKLLWKNEFFSNFRTVIKLATESKCSSYDCEYVALAIEKNTVLVTEDKKLIKTFPNVALSAINFLRQ